MLYMMLDTTRDFYLVKIGYTKDIDRRKAEYKTCNPLAKMVWKCAGSKDLEKAIHSEMASIGKRISGTEWFLITEEDFNTFKKCGFNIFKKVKSRSIKVEDYFDDKEMISLIQKSVAESTVEYSLII